MKKIQAYFRLMRWKQLKSKKGMVLVSNPDSFDEITDFGHRPYISWKENQDQSN